MRLMSFADCLAMKNCSMMNSIERVMPAAEVALGLVARELQRDEQR